MDDIENRLREMMEKIKQQDNEIKNLQEKPGKKAAPVKKPSGKPNTFRKPANGTGFGAKKFPNNSAMKKTVNNNNNNGFQGCMVEEYHVTRRTYQQPGGANQSIGRPEFWSPPAPMMGHGFDSMNHFKSNIFPDNRPGSNNGQSQRNHPEAPPPPRVVQKALDQIVCDPKVTKVRQNHHPFIVQRAYHARRCAACNQMIPKNALFIKHREIEVYPHPKYGWKGMIMSEDLITQFYHFSRDCLQKRGFESDYLNYLCVVTVSKDLWAIADEAAKRCGLVRPVLDSICMETPECTSGPVTGLADLGIDPGETGGGQLCVVRDGCNSGGAAQAAAAPEPVRTDDGQKGGTQQVADNAEIICESDSDGASDKFELC